MRRKPETLIDIFFEMAGEVFAFLVDEYGFVQSEKRDYGNEATLAYEGGDVRVGILYEAGSAPWLTIARLETIDGERCTRDEVGLARLMQVRNMADRIPLETHSGLVLDREGFRFYLGREAQNLRAVADDILRGDVTPVREAAQRLRRRR